jgi:hypothetical protein
MTTTLEQLSPRRPARTALLLAPLTRERKADRRDRHGLALSVLFARRDDLGGISPVADVLAEDVLWSV